MSVPQWIEKGQRHSGVADRMDVCEVCKHEFPVKALRFNKRKSDGVYEYQCTSCRKLIAAGELQR